MRTSFGKVYTRSQRALLVGFWLTLVVGCQNSHASFAIDTGPELDVDTGPAPRWQPVPIRCGSPCPSLDELRTEWTEAGVDLELQDVLDRRLGHLQSVQRYLCGEEVPVYRGSIQVRDDRGDFLDGYGNGEIAGDVVATLRVQRPPPFNGHARLKMFSRMGRRQLLLDQDPVSPARMTTSAVEPRDRTVPAHRTSCVDCVDSYVDGPETIRLRSFTALASAGSWRVVFDGGTLEHVDPENINAEDLLVLLEDTYQPNPTELVQTFVDRVEQDVEPLPPSLGEFDRCYVETLVEHRLIIPRECPHAARLVPHAVASAQMCCETQTPCERCDHPYTIETTCF